MTGSLAVRIHVQRKHAGKSVAGRENIFCCGSAGRKSRNTAAWIVDGQRPRDSPEPAHA
jgi:hypothetical protein